MHIHRSVAVRRRSTEKPPFFSPFIVQQQEEDERTPPDPEPQSRELPEHLLAVAHSFGLLKPAAEVIEAAPNILQQETPRSSCGGSVNGTMPSPPVSSMPMHKPCV